MKVYNFNLEDDEPGACHAIRIHGPVVLKATRRRISGFTCRRFAILASLIAKGESELTGVEHVDRGYEILMHRLCSLGVKKLKE
jgi:UDP-N-acetylglucosamine 1-carboxyvinyltransferase